MIICDYFYDIVCINVVAGFAYLWLFVIICDYFYDYR